VPPQRLTDGAVQKNQTTFKPHLSFQAFINLRCLSSCAAVIVWRSPLWFPVYLRLAPWAGLSCFQLLSSKTLFITKGLVLIPRSERRKQMIPAPVGHADAAERPVAGQQGCAATSRGG